jgi:hypothetical protein
MTIPPKRKARKRIKRRSQQTQGTIPLIPAMMAGITIPPQKGRLPNIKWMKMRIS